MGTNDLDGISGSYRDALDRARAHAQRFLDGIDSRPVGGPCDTDALRRALGGALGAGGMAAGDVIDLLAEGADPGIVASAGGRFFGFVIGGSHPSSVGADWLVSAWDQCAGFYVLSPAAVVIEEIVAEWMVDLLGLPAGTAVGFVTGCQMANFMGLASARQAVLDRVGWDCAARGLNGAPRVRVIAGAQAHGTIDRALAMLGLGAESSERVAVDSQGRMLAGDLERVLGAGDGATIVCAQAGNVDSGAFDPLREIGELCRARGAWLHVDGAFGLWAGASPGLRHLVDGVELADSWATDAHKWLNVPYDSGVVFVRDRESMLAGTNYKGAYLVREDGRHDPCRHTPESSRRARAVPIYAALRELGRDGVGALVDRVCALARRAAARLEAGGAEILNDVVLNQVLVRFAPSAGGDADAHMRGVIARVQRDGTCWLGGTEWDGRVAIRFSVSGWRTTEADVDRSVDAILRCAAVGGTPS